MFSDDLSVLEDLAEVKVKVQKLLLNQNTILNKLDKLLANDLLTYVFRRIDNQIKDSINVTLKLYILVIKYL